MEGFKKDNSGYGENLFEGIYKTAIDAIITISENGSIESFNPAAEVLFGYKPEEVIGKNVNILMPDPYHSEHDGYLDNYKKTHIRKIIGIGREVEGKRKDGSVFPLHLAVSEAYLNDKRVFIGIGRDITTIKAVEKKLKESEERAVALIDNAVDSIVTINSKGIVLNVNPAAARQFGYSAKEMIGKNITMLMPSPFREEHDQYLENYLTTGIKKVIGIGRNATGLRKNGSEFPIYLTVSEYKVGDEVYFTGIAHDLTEVKELTTINNYKSKFLANVSHEFRTPLNSIILLTSLLQKNHHENLLKEQTEMLDSIRASSKELKDLIEDILDLSKVEAGHLEIETRPINLKSFFSDFSSSIGPLVGNKKLAFSVETDGALPRTILTDRNRLKQILKNLISNALKFTDRGFIKIRVEKLTEPAGHIKISVQDSGIGIKQEDLEKIFQAFHQIKANPEKLYKGTGLGLTISRELASRLNGIISVESEFGKGSTFSLIVPENISVRQPDEQTEKNGDQEDTQRENGQAELNTKKASIKKILVVDDDERNIFALSRVLESFGYNYLTVGNGQEALNVLKNDESINLVLMDTMMPIMDGLETTRRIREDLQMKDLPIIALTGRAMKGDREECMAAGCNDYLSKPIDIDELLSLIDRLLHQ